MTHEELRKRNGTVWSFAGGLGIHEYEYLYDAGLAGRGRFRSVETGEEVSLYIAYVFKTKREGLEYHLQACKEEYAAAVERLQEAREWLDTLSQEVE